MRLITPGYFVVGSMILLLGLLSCSSAEQQQAVPKHRLNRVKARAFEVPAQAMRPPVQIPARLHLAKKNKAGKPLVLTNALIATVAPQPASVPLYLPQLTRNRPGAGGFTKPLSSPAKGQVVPLGVPEIVQAKDRDGKEQNPYNFSAFGKLQGLKHNVVSCMTQDSRGNLWLGTLGGGLCRYDGKYFTHYTDQQGLSNNSITCILEDHAGNLWLGTDGTGLSKFDGYTFTHYNTGTALAESWVTCIAEDQSQQLWIGTREQGLFKFDGKNLTHFGEKEGLGGDQVLSLLLDQKGKLWIGLLGAGLSVYEQESFARIDAKAGLIYKDVAALAEAPNGDIWMGTEKGMVRFDGQSLQTYPSAKSLASISINKNGDIWFGTLGVGAIKYNGRTFQSFSEKQGLNNSKILCMLEDSNGNFWMGTDGGGLSKFQGRVFSHLSTQEGLSSNEVFSTIEDTQGNLYFGTAGGGLTRFDGQKFAHFTESSGLGHDFIYSILQDRKGNLWLGTNGIGVVKFDGQYFTQIGEKEGLSNNTVLCILEDKTGKLWFGTRGGGVTCFDGTQFLHYGPAQGLSSDVVFSMVEDRQGQIWFGTFGGGLSCFDGQRFLQYQTSNGLSHNEVSSILCDQNGQLWFGTLGGGLNYFDGTHFTYFSTQEGLSNDAVLSLLQDKKGNLWIGTRFGLSRMSHSALESIRKKNTTYPLSSSTFFKNYSYEDGFLGIGCWRNSLYEASNGDIYIGANDRLSIYHPYTEVERSNKPQLELMDLTIYNERIPWPQLQQHPDSTFLLGNGVKVRDFRFRDLSAWNQVPQNLSLKYFNNNLGFRLIGITQQQPEKIKYQFKLEGLDDTWTSLNTNNEAAYGNLAPGIYTLRARAMNSLGIWSDELAYTFQIRPPWWRTNWMYAFYVVLLLSLLWWWRHRELQRQAQELQRERQKTEQEQKINEQLRRVDALKDQFLANTSHELRTPLQGIIGLSESLLERVQDDTQKEDLHMVISSSRRLNSLVDDILDFSKLKNQEISLSPTPLDFYSLADVVLRVMSPLVQGKKMQLINAVPNDLPPILADENRVQQVLYNLVGNAIKFSEKGHIKIAAQRDPSNPEFLHISVEDTGIGVPEDKREAIFEAFEQADGSTVRSFAGTGLGLSVSKKLLELHGGQMWLESELGKGSTFFFSLPLSNAAVSDTLLPVEPAPRILTRLSTYQNQEVPPLNPQEEGIEKVHILVVDDEAVNQQVLKNYLNKSVYRLTQVLSGEEALQVLEQDDSLDLVLLDVMMPRMSGYEVCQKIREKYLPNQLPVIMITAKNQVSDLIMGLNTGANDYIAKPFSKDEFLARLNTHLNLHRINAATQRFVPNEFIRSLGRESIMDVRLGDHVEQVVTVLFADIRNYTGLAESMSPEENFRFVSAYNRRIGPLIQKNGGFINQYLGDGIMAIFPRNPEHALQAAIDMQRELQMYNAERQSKGRKPIAIGIGLHTGPLIMGIIGDQKRMDAATVADTVNMASRMEGLTKFYGARILLSENSLRLMQNQEQFHLRNLGQVQVKGKQISMSIFECFDGDEPDLFKAKQASLALFEEALSAYMGQSFEAATNRFLKIVAANPQDFSANLFLEKSRTYAHKGVPADWTGTELMKEK